MTLQLSSLDEELPPPVEWVERNVISPGSRGGTTRLDAYQKEIIETVFMEGVESVVLMWSSQLGKSSLMVDMMLYHIANRYGDVYAMFSSQEHRKDFVNDRLKKVLVNSGLISHVELSKQGGIPKSGFQFRNREGSAGCRMTTAGSIGAGHSSSTRLIIADELDDYRGVVGVSSLRQRGVTYSDRMLVLMSTPTYKGESTIEYEYRLGSKAQYYVPCASCGWDAMHVLSIANVYPPGVYRCPSCKYEWTEEDRKASIMDGEWVHEDEGNPVRSYQMSQLYSVNVPLKKTYSDYMKMESEYERSTQILAWPYEDVERAPITQETLKRCPMPFTPAVVTVGVDVHKRFLEWVAVAFSANLERKHILARGQVLRTQGPECILALWRDVQHLGPSKVTIDIGYDYEWVARGVEYILGGLEVREYNVVELVKGKPNSFGQQLRGAVNQSKGFFHGAVDEVKVLISEDAFYGRLTLEPDLPVDTEAQLGSERLSRTQIGTRVKREWVKDRNVRNEVLDCTGYAYMGAVGLSAAVTAQMEVA